jgi:hypothetical protein
MKRRRLTLVVPVSINSLLFVPWITAREKWNFPARFCFMESGQQAKPHVDRFISTSFGNRQELFQNFSLAQKPLDDAARNAEGAKRQEMPG